MSRCNYCVNESLIRKAENRDLILTYITDTKEGGVNVYLHPKDIIIINLTHEQQEKHFAVWFMKLDDECEC